MTTGTTFADFIRTRFGTLTTGAHGPDGHACALEAWSQYEGRAWTDSPGVLDLPDVRALNDSPVWRDDAQRTDAMARLLVAVAPVWRDPARRVVFVQTVALQTIREVLPLALRAVGLDADAVACETAPDLAAARRAGAAARSAVVAARRAAAAEPILTVACEVWIAAARQAAE